MVRKIVSGISNCSIAGSSNQQLYGGGSCSISGSGSSSRGGSSCSSSSGSSSSGCSGNSSCSSSCSSSGGSGGGSSCSSGGGSSSSGNSSSSSCSCSGGVTSAPAQCLYFVAIVSPVQRLKFAATPHLSVHYSLSSSGSSCGSSHFRVSREANYRSDKIFYLYTEEKITKQLDLVARAKIILARKEVSCIFNESFCIHIYTTLSTCLVD